MIRYKILVRMWVHFRACTGVSLNSRVSCKTEVFSKFWNGFPPPAMEMKLHSFTSNNILFLFGEATEWHYDGFCVVGSSCISVGARWAGHVRRISQTCERFRCLPSSSSFFSRLKEPIVDGTTLGAEFISTKKAILINFVFNIWQLCWLHVSSTWSKL